MNLTDALQAKVHDLLNFQAAMERRWAETDEKVDVLTALNRQHQKENDKLQGEVRQLTAQIANISNRTTHAQQRVAQIEEILSEQINDTRAEVSELAGVRLPRLEKTIGSCVALMRAQDEITTNLREDLGKQISDLEERRQTGDLLALQVAMERRWGVLMSVAAQDVEALRERILRLEKKSDAVHLDTGAVRKDIARLDQAIQQLSRVDSVAHPEDPSQKTAWRPLLSNAVRKGTILVRDPAYPRVFFLASWLKVGWFFDDMDGSVVPDTYEFCPIPE